MPSHLISLPGSRAPASGVPLGTKLTHVSESAVHGSTTKLSTATAKPVLASSQATVFVPTHVVSQSKTY